MLTTGGGWQDQVCGLCPGIKYCTSKNSLPLNVESTPIKTPEGHRKAGETRLAHNMLQVFLT